MCVCGLFVCLLVMSCEEALIVVGEGRGSRIIATHT